MTTDKEQFFKGIALFTPGGDLIYCIDPNKQNRWHLHLCAALQEILSLPEPPHFLVPCYTATIDRSLNPRTQQVQIFAEAYPPVLRHQALLNAIFQMRDLVWQTAPWQEEHCDPMVLGTYREDFPQLWEEHDLVVQFEKNGFYPRWEPEQYSHLPEMPETPGYVLRLFVSGYNAATERILQNLHQLLEQSLHQPYTLKVIDVLKHPEQAEAAQVSATPTIVKIWPRPVRKIVGEIDDVEKILRLLILPDA
ncbi:circadian clock KaiB family protein [Microseira sp. BLCC-F43]|jgi:circadian clock protein KaiB|uniref:circadian clock KaiB family protein n=1 Tax=Microseira sp. BLCC-F43 TaxID=3153602 RepID=UPI0035BA6AFC